MVEGIRLGRDALVARFDLSQRLVTRIGALLSRQVDLTASVLETARPGSLLERVLLNPRVLTEAAALTTEQLRDVAAAVERAAGAALDAPLAVLAEAGWRTLALEEEVLAAGAWSRAAQPAAGGRELAVRLEALPLLAGSSELFPVVLSREEASGLFSPEELGRLKLTVLTGVDPKTKVEALRRLGLAPLSAQERASLYLRALADESPDVRKEAALVLRQLGLSLEVSEGIRAVCEASAALKPQALGRLEQIVAKAPPQERQVVMAVLLTDFRNEREPVLQAALLSTLAAFADLFSRNEEMLAALVQQVADRFVSQSGLLAEPARAFFEAVGRVAPAPLAAVLWRETERVPDRRARAYFLTLLCRTKLSDPDRERLASEVVHCIVGWNDSEVECRRLASQLKAFGEAGIRALLAGYPGADEGNRPFLIRTLDQMCLGAEIPPRQMAKVGAFLLDILGTAKRPLRLTVLESRLYFHPSLSSDLKARLAADFISNVHEFRLAQILDVTESALERLGIAAVDPLLRAAKGSPYDAEREIACKVLGRVLMTTKETGEDVRKAAEKAVSTFRSLADGPPSAQGFAVRALGRVAASPLLPTAEVVRLAAELQGMVRRTERALDAVEALGWIASGANAPLPLRMDVGLLYLGYLDGEYPVDLGRPRPSGDGIVLEVSADTAAYTDLVPVIVEGLERIALTWALTEHFREKVVERLLTKWFQTMSYEVVWGPANVTRLGEALGRIGEAPETPTHLRVSIVKALRVRLLNMPMVEALGKVLAAPDDAPPLLLLCEEIAGSLVSMTDHRDFQEREDREVILRALTRIARRSQPGRDGKKAEALRRQVADLLFRALTDEVPGCRELLAELEACESFPRKLRNAIANRLRKF